MGRIHQPRTVPLFLKLINILIPNAEERCGALKALDPLRGPFLRLARTLTPRRIRLLGTGAKELRFEVRRKRSGRPEKKSEREENFEMLHGYSA